MAKQVRRWSHTRGSRDGGGGGGPRFFSSVERKWTMEGENSRQGCEFERLGVDDIYAHRSRHQFITYSFSRARFLLPIFLPASCSHLCTNLCAVRKYKRIAKFGSKLLVPTSPPRPASISMSDRRSI